MEESFHKIAQQRNNNFFDCLQGDSSSKKFEDEEFSDPFIGIPLYGRCENNKKEKKVVGRPNQISKNLGHHWPAEVTK